MESKFKTFISKSGEYGIIELSGQDYLLIGTSNRPCLFGPETTIKDLNKYFSNFYVDGPDNKFNWEEHVPKDWKLVDVEVKVVEPVSQNPYNCFGRKPHPMDFDDRDEYDIRMASWLHWENNHAN